MHLPKRTGYYNNKEEKLTGQKSSFSFYVIQKRNIQVPVTDDICAAMGKRSWEEQNTSKTVHKKRASSFFGERNCLVEKTARRGAETLEKQAFQQKNSIIRIKTHLLSRKERQKEK